MADVEFSNHPTLPHRGFWEEILYKPGQDKKEMHEMSPQDFITRLDELINDDNERSEVRSRMSPTRAKHLDEILENHRRGKESGSIVKY